MNLGARGGPTGARRPASDCPRSGFRVELGPLVDPMSQPWNRRVEEEGGSERRPKRCMGRSFADRHTSEEAFPSTASVARPDDCCFDEPAQPAMFRADMKRLFPDTIVPLPTRPSFRTSPNRHFSRPSCCLVLSRPCRFHSHGTTFVALSCPRSQDVSHLEPTPRVLSPRCFWTPSLPSSPCEERSGRRGVSFPVPRIPDPTVT